LPVNEAMVSGIPVVAIRVGGIPEIVVDGETGFIYPVDDITALSKKLVEVYNIMKLRSKYVLNAVESKIEQYSIKKPLVKKTKRKYGRFIFFPGEA